jgi:hypothetical protein
MSDKEELAETVKYLINKLGEQTFVSDRQYRVLKKYGIGLRGGIKDGSIRVLFKLSKVF